MIDEILGVRRKKSGEVMAAAPSNADVQSELDRILASEFFKSSARCREFLKYVVDVKCSETPEPLKERTIGITIFGRSPDYDTGTDAIVRVKANDLRRRLAQYNLSADPQRPVAIELTPGSYEPMISCIHPELAADPDKAPDYKRKMLFGAVIATIVLILALAVRATSIVASPLEKFWHPFLGHDQPIICISHPGFYNLSPDKFTGKGDAPEAFHLRDYFQRMGRSSRVGIADDLSPSDFKTSPAILIGGPRFNRWTLALTQQLRFAFGAVDGKPRIIDRDNAQRFWENQTKENSFVDYVIITRLLNSQSGKSILCVAGLNAVGSKKGTELIVSSEALKKILKYAPDDWEKKNLQLVVRVSLNEHGSDDPELVASTYW
jgi:hypothetical protein